MCSAKPLASPFQTPKSIPAESPKRPLFPLGRIVATPAVLEHFDRYAINAQDYLERHLRGDWGDVCDNDARENDFSVLQGFRVLSAYNIEGDRRLWIITETDRSVTTLLWPEDY